MKYIRFFKELSIDDVPQVGGKNASLGEMYNQLSSEGINIPNGFATTSDAYWLLLSQEGLKEKIHERLKDLDATNASELQKKGAIVRKLILQTPMPKELEDEITEAYKILSKEYGLDATDVAVRSSGTAEDLPDASFAGQQESFLNISDPKELIQSVHKCFASLFNDRAISYRDSRGYDHFKVALSVGVQKMVRSDDASSGVMFSIDTQSGSDKLVLINSIWGLGENIVSGRVNADEFLVYKPMLKKGIDTILKRSLGSKKERLIYDIDNKTLNIQTTKEEQDSFSISDKEVIELAKQAMTIEKHYSKPMDIEWAKDAGENRLYIVQARPETVQSKKQKSSHIKEYELNSKDAKVLTSGIAAGERIGSGIVHIINDISEFSEFKEGEVLVAPTTNPDWEPVMKKASAVVTDKGSRTCHAAIVAREIGVSAVVGCTNATSVLKNGQIVTVSCAEGEEGFIYEGELEYSVKDIDLNSLKPTKTHLYMNVADPSQAFKLAQMPNDGVGLARMEFIMNHSINTHPMALVDMQKGKSVKDEDAIRAFMKPYTDPKEFFLNKISEGVGMIAAAFYPKPVIVRTSDFKSNEYKNMPGGSDYEADEENPMIGFRGASRYYDESCRESFEWECQALKRVRDDMGLDNVKIMLPFVRTVDEGKKVIEVMNSQGLIQGKNDLEVYAMCEIPANVILAEQFLEVFDGFSIGSNDLTQLTLGVDRDSAKIAHIFDERNDAIKEMLRMVITKSLELNKYIGICGQAPSDYPEITEFLVKNRISSISLNPDSLYKMHKLVSDLEEH